MTRSQLNPLDSLSPELARDADRLAAELVATLARARDHVLDPKRHRLSADPLETRLAASLGRYKSRLRPGQLTVPPIAARPGERTPKAGTFSEAQLRAEIDKLYAGDFAAIASGTPRAIVSRALNINSLTCVQDTLEPGKDEMVVGTVATTLRVLGDGTVSTAVTTSEVDLGQFKKSDAVTFDPPRPIAAFDAIETPAVLSVHLVLAESDIAGGVGAVLRDLVDGIENRFNGKKFTALITSASLLVAIVPVAAAVVDGTIIAVIVNMAVLFGLVAIIAAAIAALLVAIFALFRDEVFPTQTVAISLDEPGAVIAGTTAPIPLRFSRQVAVYDAVVQFA